MSETWEPKTPRYRCASSTTTKSSRLRTEENRWWPGNRDRCSMSGFVSRTFAWRRAQSRSSREVSPSYVVGRSPWRTRPRRDSSWSAASAFVGER